ncbi:MAG: hypothetical protein GY870_18845, partial [archaeon]|nr:hypothetical protein [archaeon]
MSKKKRNKQNKFILNKTIERVEYYRSAIALLPEETDINPGVAYLKVDEKKEREERFCTCGSSKRATCSHVKELMDIHRGMVHVHGKNRFEENFQSSLWYCLFQIMVEKNKITPTSVVYKTEKKNNLEYLKTTTIKDDDLVLYYSKKSDIYRFIERCTQNGNENNDNYRQDVYKNLSNLMLTENERAMAYKGYKTRRMAQEESFWYFFTYHCFREFEYREYTLKTDITDKTCVFILICLDKKGNPIFEIPIPRENVKAVNEKIVKKFSVKQNIPTHPIPMEPVLDVSLENKAINISVVYRFMDSNKKIEYLKNESLLPFKYGNIFHIKEKNILAEVQPSREIVNKFIKNNKCTILEDDIPEFLLTHGKELKEGPHLVDPELKNIKIINAFDNMVIHPKIINRDWCWLSVDYGWGDSAVSLTEILEARDKNYRFIKTDNGWIDTNSPN